MEQEQISPFLARDQATAALNQRGYKISPKTLATLATRGGGPSYRKFGRRPLYLLADLIAWAEGRLSAPRRSTSEGDAERTA